MSKAPLGIFERYLTIWVALAIVGGVALGALWPQGMAVLAQLEVAQVNIPVGVYSSLPWCTP